jgi:hypothetical protein
VAWFEVHAVNHESIHNHSAFARLEWRRATSSSHSTQLARRTAVVARNDLERC